MTENERGTYVVYLIPAVIGCLTIILARRWAYSQINSSTTTGISRRRKIIKDNLVKRPVPPAASSKMIPPGSKKSSAYGKKKTSSYEEECVSNGRIGRSMKGSQSWQTNSSEPKMLYHVLTIKHMPFPNIPLDGELLYEAMTFLFMAVAMGLQYLNLYRTVWWLPNSYNNQTMNFYLIDLHVVAFILIVLSRRFLFCIVMTVIKSVLAPKLWRNAHAAARMFVLGALLGALAWCLYFIHIKYSIVKLFFLCYPIIIYLVLFGFQARAFLDLSPEIPTMHCCSMDANNIREEIDVLREDFNHRIKMMMFCSVVGAYYTSFIPCCFAPSSLYYDVQGAAQQTALVWGTLVCRVASYLLAAHYCDVLHRAALHLGDWYPTQLSITNTLTPWNDTTLWIMGSRVTYNGVVWESKARLTAAKPGCISHARYYKIFRNPSIVQCILLCLQLALVVVQLLLLFSTSLIWHHIISVTMLLFINYYTLFKLLRDYIVAWKVYKAEQMIQERANNGTVN